MDLRSFVLETLSARQVDRLNFRVGRSLVYPQGYNRDIHRAVSSGVIEVTTDVARVAGDAHSQAYTTANASGAFRSAAPGRRHHLWLHPRYVTPGSGGGLELRALTAIENAMLRSTIIHECTHALQDYQRVGLTPAEAEASAHLAGAITRMQYGYRIQVARPYASIHSLCNVIAQRIVFGPTNPRAYLIEQPELQILLLLAERSTGSEQNYVNDGL